MGFYRPKVRKGSLLIILLFGLCVFVVGCKSTPSAEMFVESSTFNYTPQEYIDKINSLVESAGDSRYLEIPEFESSKKAIDIDGIYLSLTITTDSSGKIEEIYYDWDGTRKDVGYSIGLYSSATIGMISPGDADIIIDKLDMMDSSSNHYETSCSYDGTLYGYRMIGSGQFNYLTIAPDLSQESNA